MDAALNTGNYNTKTGNFGIEPKMFALLLGIASVIMMFAGLTSAYLVKRANVDTWIHFNLPKEFLVSCGIILLSSVTLHGAWVFYRKQNRTGYAVMLGTTLLLGIGFLISQFAGWSALQSIGIDWVGNPSGGFVYAISWFHAAHIIGGLVILLISFVMAIKRMDDPIGDLRSTINPEGKLKVKMMCVYWHFVDLLWIYLFLFLYFNHQ